MDDLAFSFLSSQRCVSGGQSVERRSGGPLDGGCRSERTKNQNKMAVPVNSKASASISAPTGLHVSYLRVVRLKSNRIISSPLISTGCATDWNSSCQAVTIYLPGGSFPRR